MCFTTPLNIIISFENAPVPISMFNDDGTKRSTQKFDFMHKLEDLLSKKAPTRVLDKALVIDAMQIMQIWLNSNSNQ